MSEKIVVSKPGIDGGTATDANDLIFSSDYQTLRYSTSGTIGLVVSANDGNYHEYNVFVSHNLGYHPFFLANITFDGTIWYPLPYAFNTISELDNYWAYSGTNGIQFITEQYHAGAAQAAGTPTIKYFIFKNDTNI